VNRIAERVMDFGKFYGRMAIIALAALPVFALPMAAQRILRGWTVAFPPHHIAGNLYYVGSEDLASYLNVTPEGDILINSSLKESVPLIKQSVEQLGFHFNDIKILLISHAHCDHAEGSEMLLKMTGAKYYVMDADVPTIESGGKEDFKYGRDRWAHFPAVKVDRVLHDGDKVELGGAVLLVTPRERPLGRWTKQRAARSCMSSSLVVRM
jgi:metallo-beta-lactamase class B